MMQLKNTYNRHTFFPEIVTFIFLYFLYLQKVPVFYRNVFYLNVYVSLPVLR